ncbi:MAG: transcription elongation factor Spt5 [Thermoproteota archaeon]|nr:transcription elongation factor Spt5 [Thermoproteota archaeon]
MSDKLKEKDEDISNLDEIFDDNRDNFDKSSESGEPAVTDSRPLEDNRENDYGQPIVQEDSSPEPEESSDREVQEEGAGEEEKKEKEDRLGTTSRGEDDSTTSTTDDTARTASTGVPVSAGDRSQSSSSSAALVPPSPVPDSKFYAIRTTGGQERVVANVLQNKIKSKNIGIYSILLLENFKGYIVVEAPDANVAFQALAGVRHIRGQIRGELPFRDIEGYLVKKPVVTELAIDDTVEVIGGPFKAMKAKITRVDYEKQEATVVLLDSPYQIPVTVDANYLKKSSH